MGRKMNNAPVYFALAQVKFNQLAALDNYIPAVQDSLRKAGYPDFQPIQMAQIYRRCRCNTQTSNDHALPVPKFKEEQWFRTRSIMDHVSDNKL